MTTVPRQLADGPLTVYDLEQLSHAPPVVVLTACSAGRVATANGTEVVGAVAVLLDRGVTNVVAPVAAVADLPAAAVARQLYASWAAGAGLADALAEARRSAAAAGRDRDRIVAGVLTCFGR